MAGDSSSTRGTAAIRSRYVPRQFGRPPAPKVLAKFRGLAVARHQLSMSGLTAGPTELLDRFRAIASCAELIDASPSGIGVEEFLFALIGLPSSLVRRQLSGVARVDCDRSQPWRHEHRGVPFPKVPPTRKEGPLNESALEPRREHSLRAGQLVSGNAVGCIATGLTDRSDKLQLEADPGVPSFQ